MLGCQACCISSQKVISAAAQFPAAVERCPQTAGESRRSNPAKFSAGREPRAPRARFGTFAAALHTATVLLYGACINVLMTSELNCSTPITNGLLYSAVCELVFTSSEANLSAQLYISSRGERTLEWERERVRHSKVNAQRGEILHSTQFIKCAAPAKWN